MRAGNTAWVSGTAPVWPDSSCHPDPERQAARCFAIVVAALLEPRWTVEIEAEAHLEGPA